MEIMERTDSEQQEKKKPTIIDRAVNANRKIDYYWRTGVLWFWGILGLLIVLYVCGIIFNILGL
jgi:hypothetical protein